MPLLDASVLTQATCVDEAAARLLTEAATESELELETVVAALTPGHPQLGVRRLPDELLEVFRGEIQSLPPQIDQVERELVEAWRTSRGIYEDLMVSQGWAAGYRDDETTFFTKGGVALGVGQSGDTPMSRRYGRGLTVLSIVSPPLESPADSLTINSGNVRMSAEGISQLGHLLQLGEVGQSTLAVETYLPGSFLALYRTDTSDLAIAVFNAVGAIAAGARCVVIAGGAPAECV